MKRSARLTSRTGILRRSRVPKVSRTRRAGRVAWEAEYDKVDARSGGWCEIKGAHGYITNPDGVRHPATEHHHLFKPRRTFHQVQNILHVCRAGHREFERPYALGRRVITGFNEAKGRYETALVTAQDKWQARARARQGVSNA